MRSICVQQEQCGRAPMMKEAIKLTNTVMAMPAWRVSKVWISEGTCTTAVHWSQDAAGLMHISSGLTCMLCCLQLKRGWNGGGQLTSQPRGPQEKAKQNTKTQKRVRRPSPDAVLMWPLSKWVLKTVAVAICAMSMMVPAM